VTRFVRLLLPALIALIGSAGVGIAAEPAQVRVLSYNIHHGEGIDRRIDLERIAGVVRSVEPDVVALQEVDRRTRRSGGVDQPAELARLTGLPVVFGRSIDFAGGEYGNAVLSRLPIRRHEVIELPNPAEGEPRTLLHVELECQTGAADVTFDLYATHFDHASERNRAASARFVNERIRGADRPALLAGDLNATPDSESMTILARQWTLPRSAASLATVPVEGPVRQIDYVLYRPADRWKVVETRVLDEKVASDHRAILVVLQSTSGK
jgi:endonuclease/exonuclease/phosphatase family metal-dependent hydrolase